jgi:hypothetical protein
MKYYYAIMVRIILMVLGSVLRIILMLEEVCATIDFSF